MRDFTGMDPITPDGGIMKITLREAKSSDPTPKWIRGANARFHYSVFLYSPKSCPKKKETGKHEHEEHMDCKVHAADSCGDKHDHEHGNDAKGDERSVVRKSSKKRELKPVRRKVADSREDNPDTPFELRIGYKFSVTGMELAVKSMKVGETARFLCMPQYCEGYVQLAKVLKQEKENKANALKGIPAKRIQGCCAHSMREEMEAQTDLAELHGVPLEFEIELLEVQMPDAYVREPWEMEAIDKYREAPIRKEEGGTLYKQGKYEEALAKYTRALTLLESLSMSSIVQDMARPGGAKHEEIDLATLNQLTLTCRLNYAACKLKLEDYEPVIAQCTEVLKTDSDNVKALFRRGQAYTRIGRDLDLAQEDFANLEGALGKADVEKQRLEWTELRKERQLLESKLKTYREKERKMYGSIFG